MKVMIERIAFLVSYWPENEKKVITKHFKFRDDAANYVKYLIRNDMASLIKVLVHDDEHGCFDIYRYVWQEGKWIVSGESLQKVLELEKINKCKQELIDQPIF